MLLKNYYKVCQVMVLFSQISDVTYMIPTHMQPRSTSGANVQHLYLNNNSTLGFFTPRHLLWEPLYSGIKDQTASGALSTNVGYNSDILLGSGNTPVTEDDYKIESQITTGLSCTAVGYTLSEDCKRYTVTKTFQNTSEEGMVIKEIGFMVGCYDQKNILVAREVLEEPMTIEAGKVFNISFTFDF